MRLNFIVTQVDCCVYYNFDLIVHFDLNVILMLHNNSFFYYFCIKDYNLCIKGIHIKMFKFYVLPILSEFLPQF